MRMVPLLMTTALVLSGTTPAWADGTETLGPPSVTLARGTGIAVGGVGLMAQPAALEVTVPGDATVEQVLLYLESGHRPGDASGEAHDATVRLDGTEVATELIGGATPFYGTVQTATHRADVTALGLVTPGENTIEVDGLDTDEVADGAGLVVIYSHPGEARDLFLVDGNDIAFADFEPPRDTTVPQTFDFAPADVDRTAELSVLTASVHDPAPRPNPSGNQRNRPNALEVTSGGVTTLLPDPLGDALPEWDSGTVPVTIPAGATSVTVRYLSTRDATGDLPASLVWLAAGLVVPATPPVVTPTPTPPATAAEAAATAVQAEAVTTTVPTEVLDAAVDRGLPATGGHTGALAAAAAALTALGTTLLVVARRQRRHHDQPGLRTAS
jgi:LPXTG-motif cell wall-anchored protein